MTSLEEPVTPQSLCPKPWAAVWSMLMGFFMLMLDQTIVTVANPSIQAGLGASLTETIWVTSAYLLGLATPLLVAGRLGDRFGQKTIFMIGMAVFALASLACGLAPSVGLLITARAVQGVGGALMTPQTQAIIVRIFPPHRRGAAMGLWGSVAGIATLVGPVIGGLLVQTIGWQAIFLINVPVGVIGLILATKFIPALPTSRPKFDWTGVVISALGIFLLVYGLQEGVDRQWGRAWGPITITEIIAAGLVLLVVFVVYQTHARSPLVPLKLFRDRDFSFANAAIFLVGVGMSGLMLPVLYFIQVGRGFAPMASALFQMPSAVVGAILAPLVGARFIAKIGANKVACFGAVAMAVPLAWYTLYFTPDSNIWLALLPGFVLGLGNACLWSPLSLSATHHLPRTDAGAGAGIYNTVRQIGTVLGSALMNTLMNARLIAHHVSPNIASQAGTNGLAGPVAFDYARAMAECLFMPCAVFIVVAVLAAFLTGQAGRQEPAPTAAVRAANGGER